MPATRPRRIVRRAVIALAVVVLLLAAYVAWSGARETVEIGKSRAIKLGMSVAEAEAVMGRPAEPFRDLSPSGVNNWLLYGPSPQDQPRLVNLFNDLIGRGYTSPPDVTVRLRLNANGRVDRIKRGDEPEESAQQ